MAIEAGVDAVDVASAPMAGTTSQVPASALVAACANTERPTNLDLRAVMELEPYWEAVRKVYAPFESGCPARPAGSTTMRFPAGSFPIFGSRRSHWVWEKFEQIEAMYTAASAILGRPPKVTPSSKVVGDLALHLVAVGADPDDFAENPQNYDIPDSVIGFPTGNSAILPAAGRSRSGPRRCRGVRCRSATSSSLRKIQLILTTRARYARPR